MVPWTNFQLGWAVILEKMSKIVPDGLVYFMFCITVLSVFVCFELFVFRARPWHYQRYQARLDAWMVWRK